MHPDNYRLINVSLKANAVAQILAAQLRLQPGYGIAAYLGLNENYTNMGALRLWVHHKLETQPPEYNTVTALKDAFIACFPADIQSSL